MSLIALNCHILAAPSTFSYERDGKTNVLYKTPVLIDGQTFDLVGREDPLVGLNGTAERVAAGEITQAIAHVDLYKDRRGRMAFGFTGFVEAQAAGKK